MKYLCHLYVLTLTLHAILALYGEQRRDGISAQLKNFGLTTERRESIINIPKPFPKQPGLRWLSLYGIDKKRPCKKGNRRRIFCKQWIRFHFYIIVWWFLNAIQSKMINEYISYQLSKPSVVYIELQRIIKLKAKYWQTHTQINFNAVCYLVPKEFVFLLHPNKTYMYPVLSRYIVFMS